MSPKILFIFGTRPEAIKLAPLILHFKKSKNINPRICITGQHKELLDSALEAFGLNADIDLAIMQPKQKLADLTSKLISLLSATIEKEQPALIIVQGDTSSAMCGALAAFYNKVPVAHIEAGLRSGDNYSPFPEEVNRRIISQIAQQHFCPTEANLNNLKEEGITKNVFCTGNTGIDALKIMRDKLASRPELISTELITQLNTKNIILVTIHRRENIPYLGKIATMLNHFSREKEVSKIIFLSHPNPAVKDALLPQLTENNNLLLLPAQSYPNMVYLLQKARMLITDSGGLQEEATYLGLPTIILRKETERNEAIANGHSILVSPEHDEMLTSIVNIITDEKQLLSMSKPSKIYGDGNSSELIFEVLQKSIQTT